MAQAELSPRRLTDGTLVLEFSGPWQMRGRLPSLGVVQRELERGTPGRVTFDTAKLTAWDSGLLTFLEKVTELCQQHQIAAEREGLPSGVRRLLALAEAVPERKGARQEGTVPPRLARLGMAVMAARQPLLDMLGFIGEITVSIGKLARGRARYRTQDLMLLIQEVGAQALGIITLISVLVGMIFAFVGAVQLQQFGAAIYVADLVGIAMVREMGAMMTAIVMAGRTGAAFAAQLGSMKVNQEIDALKTMGISELEFLVLPRMIALCLMMPLLCLYADFLGILGGAVVGVGMLHLPPVVYYHETAHAVHLADLIGGVSKAAVYGVLVAISGCMRGMQCGNSSSAVGEAATSAVVTGIVFVISACGIFSVIFYVMGW